MPDPAAPDDRPAWLRAQSDPRGSATPPRDPDDPAAGPAQIPAGPGAPAWPATTTGQQTCYRHPDRPASLRCSRCNRLICGDCSQPAPVGQLCPDDARDRQPVRGPAASQAPVVTWAILIVNAVMLGVEALLSGGSRGFIDPDGLALCRLGALNAAAIAESGQWWRLLTVMVLHAGVIHFALNSYALWVFGPVLERFLGHARFLAVYLIAGFLGSAASFAINDTPLGVGASGAIFGLLGGLVAFFWRRRDRGGMAQLRGLLIVVVLNLALSASMPNIDNVAHIGGLLGGLLAVWMLDAVPQRGTALGARRALALAVPVMAGLALVAVGVATFPGSPYNCAGV